ncbi:MAG TPA: hypothetical protein ENN06_02225 [Desulfobacteraceae bacterium]|nr:hypothetical protein [Desulfobacteraceae bacterium]
MNGPCEKESLPESNRHGARLIALAAVGFLALNYPLLSLFSKIRLLFGIPVLYIYIFAVWYLFIICVALILAKPLVRAPMPPPRKTEKPE